MTAWDAPGLQLIAVPRCLALLALRRRRAAAPAQAEGKARLQGEDRLGAAEQQAGGRQGAAGPSGSRGPRNHEANHTVPTRKADLRYFRANSDMPYARCVNGRFRGSTDDIIEWAATSGGCREDLLRAVAVHETWWDNHFVGDNGDSFGIFQVRRPYHCCLPFMRDSTAFNADYYGGIIRAYYDGKQGWLNNPDVAPENGRRYRAGDLWGSVGAWYSGRWRTAGQRGLRRRGQEAHAQAHLEDPPLLRRESRRRLRRPRPTRAAGCGGSRRTCGLPWRVTWIASPAAARSMYQPKRLRNSWAPTCSTSAVSRIRISGADGTRTHDLCGATAALSQLSYSPRELVFGGEAVADARCPFRGGRAGGARLPDPARVSMRIR